MRLDESTKEKEVQEPNLSALQYSDIEDPRKKTPEETKKQWLMREKEK